MGHKLANPPLLARLGRTRCRSDILSYFDKEAQRLVDRLVRRKDRRDIGTQQHQVASNPIGLEVLAPNPFTEVCAAVFNTKPIVITAVS
jgi:hypothetical protein